MKGKKFLLCIGAFSFCIAAAGCDRKNEEEFIEALISMEQTVYKHDEVSPETVDEVRNIVKRYRDELGEEVTRTEEFGRLLKRIAEKYMEIGDINREIERLSTGRSTRFDSPREEDIYRKMEVIRYIDGTMYGKAFEKINEALELFPDNRVLYYNGGVCAGWIAKSKIEPRFSDERARWFETAQAYYRRAIELDSGYVDALYGLAVLLVFELDAPSEAIGFLERIVEKESRNMDALFVLARAYYQIGRYDEAMDTYEIIIEENPSEEMTQRARALKERIKDEVYGLE
ncbi:MAG: tetratricopeptide repeat protein [Spirochaetales bacterium]|nr:tetratricopeptide repeat protein [Spirochaetales bacterium]